MRRVFTKDAGRYKAGEERDWPASVWRHVEGNAKRSLESFTRPVEEVVRRGVGLDPRRPAPR